MEKLASNNKNLKVFHGADHWLYQSIVPNVSSKYGIEQKRELSTTAKNWLENQSALK
jgi:hypothetical protein